MHQVYSQSISSGNILVFAEVTPSQSVRSLPHKVWIVCKPDGEILCGYCSCTAGYSKCCNHVIAVLYKVEFANEKGLTDPACTDQTYSGAQNHMYIDREHCVSRSRSRSVICSHFSRTVIEICSNFAREMIASIFDREHLCEQPLNFKQFRRM